MVRSENEMKKHYAIIRARKTDLLPCHSNFEMAQEIKEALK